MASFAAKMCAFAPAGTGFRAEALLAAKTPAVKTPATKTTR